MYHHTLSLSSLCFNRTTSYTVGDKLIIRLKIKLRSKCLHSEWYTDRREEKIFDVIVTRIEIKKHAENRIPLSLKQLAYRLTSNQMEAVERERVENSIPRRVSSNEKKR